MRSKVTLIALSLVAVLFVLPAAVQAQDTAAPQYHFVTVTKFSAPFNDEGGKVWWWIDSVVVPIAKMDPNVVSMQVGGHNWGSSAGDIVMITEFADWNAINADCAACNEWFEQRRPAEGTPEREAWDEAAAAYFKHYYKHHDEIYRVRDSRSK